MDNSDARFPGAPNCQICTELKGAPELCVIDGDPATLDSLCLYFSAVGCRVRAFSNAITCLNALAEYEPDCIVTELIMQGMTGLQLCRELRNSGRHLPLVVVTNHGDVSSAVEMMKLGAVDYLEKPCSKEQLLQSVNCGVMRARLWRAMQNEEQDVQRRFAKLSGREKEILGLIGDGLVTKQIATQLGISHRTVDVHRSKLLHKLEIDSPSQLSRILMFLHRDKSPTNRDFWIPMPPTHQPT